MYNVITMGLITKGIKGILKITKTQTLTRSGYSAFLETVSKKNGVKYVLASDKEVKAIQELVERVGKKQVKDTILNSTFVRNTDKEFDLSEVEKGLKEGLRNQRRKLDQEMLDLVGQDLTEKEMKKELKKLTDKAREQKQKYIIKFEEIKQTQEGYAFTEHSPARSIIGTKRSSWCAGASYNPRKRLMLFTGKQGDDVGQWLIHNVPYGKWLILRDYQGFVPYNGMGTYTIRNIKRKKEWKKI